MARCPTIWLPKHHIWWQDDTRRRTVWRQYQGGFLADRLWLLAPQGWSTNATANVICMANRASIHFLTAVMSCVICQQQPWYLDSPSPNEPQRIYSVSIWLIFRRLSGPMLLASVSCYFCNNNKAICSAGNMKLMRVEAEKPDQGQKQKILSP